MTRFLSLSDYLKNVYHTKVYKIALDGGFTCPNRDGTVGIGGCIFCNGGSGAFSFPVTPETVSSQLREGKNKIASKLGKNPLLIAYFQSYTNTYAPIEKLKSLFEAAIRDEQVVILSIATRPDCLSDDVISLLAQLNQIKPVWVELGLQTIHERTAQYIRRGYPLSVYVDAVHRLKKANLSVITHMIVGLPGEDESDMQNTAKFIAENKTDGIKIQLLHILEGTDLAREYKAGRVSVLTQEEYIKILLNILRVLPPQMVIHRMTGDGAKKDLLAPLWSARKRDVRNAIYRAMEKENIFQGECTNVQ